MPFRTVKWIVDLVCECARPLVAVLLVAIAVLAGVVFSLYRLNVAQSHEYAVHTDALASTISELREQRRADAIEYLEKIIDNQRKQLENQRNMLSNQEELKQQLK